MSRTSVLAGLICVNLVLVTALLFVGTTPRVAQAQPAGQASNYMIVAGEVMDEFDALYIVDMRERTLHTFVFRRGTRELEYGGYRLLDRDFRHNKDAP